MSRTVAVSSPLVSVALSRRVATVVPCTSLELNDSQRLAVETTEGPLLVLSGAGTGKTRTITHRIVHIVTACGVRPNRILGVTFTNKAAEEMKGRVIELLELEGNRDGVSPVLCTFHSLGARLLRRYVDALGIGLTRSFSIYDQSDSSRLITALIKELGIDAEQTSAAYCADRISVAKNSGLSAEEFERTVPTLDETAATVSRVYLLYQERLRASNAVDLDDLLFLTVHLLRTRPQIRKTLADWFRYVLVDEYQDTNALQLELTQHLSSVHGNICAVADDDQSIYSWRGAVITNTLEFQKHFPGALVLRLEENYRSSPQILAAASAVIENNQQRMGKKLWTRRRAGVPVRLFEAADCDSEAEYVADRVAEVLESRSNELPAVGILYRTNTQARLIEDALRERKIPYVIAGGMSFYARAEIKDVMAYARLAANPDDRAAFERAVSKPSRGIGAKAIASLCRLADNRKVGLWAVVQAEVESLQRQRKPEAKLTGAAFAALGEFYRFIEELRRLGNNADISGLVNSAIHDTGYADSLAQKTGDEAEARIKHLAELVEHSRQYDGKVGALRDFIDRATLVSAVDDEPGDEKAPVLLATIHAAKGLEFPYVFVIGLEDNLFPHVRSLESDSGIEEERRLCYVALTRAREQLTVSYARRRRVFNRMTSSKYSRFLSEIPQELLFIDNGFSEFPRL